MRKFSPSKFSYQLHNGFPSKKALFGCSLSKRRRNIFFRECQTAAVLQTGEIFAELFFRSKNKTLHDLFHEVDKNFMQNNPAWTDLQQFLWSRNDFPWFRTFPAEVTENATAHFSYSASTFLYSHFSKNKPYQNISHTFLHIFVRWFFFTFIVVDLLRFFDSKNFVLLITFAQTLLLQIKSDKLKIYYFSFKMTPFPWFLVQTCESLSTLKFHLMLQKGRRVQWLRNRPAFVYLERTVYSYKSRGVGIFCN